MLKLATLLVGCAAVANFFAAPICTAASDKRVAEVDARLGHPQALSPDFIGFNGNLSMLGSDPWDRSDLIAGAKRLRPRTIRYPGGTLSSFWNWRLGWLDPEIGDDLLFGFVKGPLRDRNTRYTLDGLMKGVRAIGFQPVYVLNMLDVPGKKAGSRLSEARRALDRAHDIGLPVNYVELGNEYYFGVPLVKYNFPSPERYGQVACDWIRVLKRDQPGCKFALVGGGPMRNIRNRNWTRRVLSRCTDADAITLHMYMQTGLSEPNDNRRVTSKGMNEGAGRTRSVRATPYEKSAAAIGRLFSFRGYTEMMSAGHRALSETMDRANIPVDPGLRIWVTEWNIAQHAGPESGTWASALFIGLVYDSMLTDGRIDLSLVHNLVGNRFPVLYSGSNPLAQVKHIRIRREDDGFGLAPAGIVSELLGRAMNGRSQAWPLIFKENRDLSANEEDLPVLYGWMFGAGNTPDSGFLINLDAEPVDIRLEGGGAGMEVRTLSAAPADVILQSPPVERAVVTLDGTIRLPDYSLAQVRLGANGARLDTETVHSLGPRFEEERVH